MPVDPGTGPPDWLADFDYALPDEQIARRPAEPRDSSRLLVLDRASGARTQTTFRNLPHWLRPGDLLVLNETRVLRARLHTLLERTGRSVEVLFSHPEGEDWIALLGPGRRLRPGDRLLPVPSPASELIGAADPARALVIVGPEGQGQWRLRSAGATVPEILSALGRVPLPPYLDREDRPIDREWYQTIFARRDGAVAAPTAGLHFTPELLTRFAQGGIATTRVVLHVGPGTFLPVRAAVREQHRVLPERYEVPSEAVAAMRAARAAGRRIVAVGTTVVRALETAARSELIERPEGAADPVVAAGSGWTDLTITPGHRFRAVDALVTNFHLPRSSLLLLVAAFAGRETILDAYAEARDAGFRFYSYGDAMLIQ